MGGAGSARGGGGDGLDDGVDGAQEEIGGEAGQEESGEEEESGDAFGEGEVRDWGFEGVRERAFEDGAEGAEHVDCADDDAPECEDGTGLEPAEVVWGFRGEAAEEDIDFCGEVGEAGEPDGGEGGHAEGEAEERGGLGEAAEAVELERAGFFADGGAECEEEGDGDPVGEHEEDSAGVADG